MIKVRFFGLIRVYSGQRQIEVEAKTVRDALKKATELGVDNTLLSSALIFVNNRQLTGTRRMSYKLSPGDELSLLSPAGGG